MRLLSLAILGGAGLIAYAIASSTAFARALLAFVSVVLVLEFWLEFRRTK